MWNRITFIKYKFEPRSDAVYSIQHYVIKFVSDLRQVGDFLRYTNKTDHHVITEISLKVALNTISLTIAWRLFCPS